MIILHVNFSKFAHVSEAGRSSLLTYSMTSIA
jgi:hypothetical protein